MKFRETWNQPRGVFLGCFFLLFLRAFPRVFQADIWGEDALYLSEGLQHGIASLLIPFAGVFHLIERGVLLLVSSVFPVSVWAIAITWLWFLASVYVFSMFARRDYRWLIESDSTRAILCLILCLTPGLNEMLGNMANINWIAVLYLMLILLREPVTSPRLGETVIALIVFFSIGTGITLVPLLVWRIWAGIRSKRFAYPEAFWLFSVIASHGVFIAIRPHLVAMGDTYTPGGIPTLTQFVGEAPYALRNTISRSGFVRPWIGSGFASKLIDNASIGYLTGWICLALIPYILFWRKRETNVQRFAATLIFSASFYLWLLPAFMARTGALVVFLTGGYWHYRYAFPLSIGATVFWFASLYVVDEKRRNLRSFFALFCFLSFLHGLDRFFICPYAGCANTTPSWYYRSQPLADKLAGKTSEPVQIDVFPTGWAVKLP